jgi:hypothetical protein
MIARDLARRLGLLALVGGGAVRDPTWRNGVVEPLRVEQEQRASG